MAGAAAIDDVDIIDKKQLRSVKPHVPYLAAQTRRRCQVGND
jgi:hypothetical protein